jgi:hypothetical protein
MTTIPLRVYKASSIHKAQGLSVGPNENIKKCIVGVSAGGRSSTPGLDLVGFSRATEQGALALWGDVEFSKKDLLTIGRGKGYDSKRDFEAKLRNLQAEAVPPMVETIAALSDEMTFEGGYQFLMRWFRKFTGTTPPLPIPTPIDETSSPLVLEATPLVSIQNMATTTGTTQPTDDSDILEVYENTSQTQTSKLPFKAQLFLSVRPGEFPPTFGTVCDVPGDGNCGYHALRLGLLDLGILPRNFRSISRMRKHIRDWSISNAVTLQVLLPQMVNSDFERFLFVVYDEFYAGSFDGVVPMEYWMALDYLPFVILLMFKLKYVVIFVKLATGPRTYIYERQEEPPKLVFWNAEGFHFPEDAHHTTDSIFMIFLGDEGHYNYIQL